MKRSAVSREYIHFRSGCDRNSLTRSSLQFYLLSNNLRNERCKPFKIVNFALQKITSEEKPDARNLRYSCQRCWQVFKTVSLCLCDNTQMQTQLLGSKLVHKLAIKSRYIFSSRRQVLVTKNQPNVIWPLQRRDYSSVEMLPPALAGNTHGCTYLFT